MAARSVLVTGANRGLGLEMVRQLAAGPPGRHVVACCRDPSGPRSQVPSPASSAAGNRAEQPRPASSGRNGNQLKEINNSFIVPLKRSTYKYIHYISNTLAV